MATYTVSYRGKNGERIEEQFEAPDRNSLFKILADRKISAISVKDGAAPKRKKSSAPSKPLPPSVLRGAVAGIVVVALAGALFLVFGNRDVKPEEKSDKKSNNIREVAAGVPTGNTDTQKESGYGDEVVREKTLEEKLMEGKDPHDWIVITNRHGKIKCVRLFHPGGEQPTPIFAHMSENELDEICLGEPGERVMDIPLDERFRADLTQALIDPIEILPEDSEEVAEKKNQMIALKEEIRDAIKKGEDPIALIREAMEERNRIATYRENVIEMIAEKKREGATEEELNDMRAAANKLLSDKGAKLLRSAEQFRENLLKKRLEK